MDTYTSLDEFEFLADQILDCSWVSGKIPLDLQWERCYNHSSTFSFEWILILEGNKDNYKSLNGF